MNRFKRRTAGSVVLTLMFILTFWIMLYASTVRAQDTEAITPNQEPISFINMFQGQTATVSVSPFTGFGMKTVFVTSVGNKTLSAGISGGLSPKTALGWWIVSILGTGGKNWGDLSLGLVPWGGPAATIDIGSGVSFAIVTSTVFVTTPDAVSYTLNIAH
jgi:hypothetical protein